MYVLSDYDSMQLICASMPLKDRMVCLQKVPIPTMIQVRPSGKSDIKLDAEELELYFESAKSGGSFINGDIDFYCNNECAVIDFDDAKGKS